MKILALVFVLIFILLASSCKDVGISSDDAASFKYIAFDTLGNTVARGTLWLQFNSSNVSGKWKFDDGRMGELEGTIQDSIISLNLNPRFVDDNLILRGQLRDKRRSYAGEWHQIGFPGVMAQGTFVATRK